MQLNMRRGDTLIEVLFSITVFALVAVITVNLMNGGIHTAQRSLEITTTRNEMDAQAEALRFIHNSYLSERQLASGAKQFQKLWLRLTEDRNTALDQSRIPGLMAALNNIGNCNEMYDASRPFSVQNVRAFALNTRLMQPEQAGITDYEVGDFIGYGSMLDLMVVSASDAIAGQRFVPTQLSPRIIFNGRGGSIEDDEGSGGGVLKEQVVVRQVAQVEGIWIISVKGGTIVRGQPEYYDFHIRTCWHSVGRRAPSTISTIVRLYNPEVIESEQR